MKAVILLADNFEDIEAFTPIDVLHRAGIEVAKAGLNSKVVTSAHGIRVMADKLVNVLATAGILDNKIAVVASGLKKMAPKVRDAKVIASGNVVTSKNPSTALEFSLMLVERSLGKKTSAKIRASIGG